MPVPVTAFYAGLLALIMIVLMSLVGLMRGRKSISLGNAANDPELMVADRRHMNFVENVPMALLLIAIVEANGAGKLWVHALGAALLVSRLLHPLGLDALKMQSLTRGIGAGGTMLVTIAAALTAIWQFLR